MRFVVLVLFSMNGMMMNGDCHNMRLKNDWIWDFDCLGFKINSFTNKFKKNFILTWNMNWIRHFDFLNHWHFNFLINGKLFCVMMMNCVDFVGNFNLDSLMMTAIIFN